VDVNKPGRPSLDTPAIILLNTPRPLKDYDHGICVWQKPFPNPGTDVNGKALDTKKFLTG
jgi:hypothetical protein